MSCIWPWCTSELPTVLWFLLLSVLVHFPLTAQLGMPLNSCPKWEASISPATSPVENGMQCVTWGKEKQESFPEWRDTQFYFLSGLRKQLTHWAHQHWSSSCTAGKFALGVAARLCWENFSYDYEKKNLYLIQWEAMLEWMAVTTTLTMHSLLETPPTILMAFKARLAQQLLDYHPLDRFQQPSTTI